MLSPLSLISNSNKPFSTNPFTPYTNSAIEGLTGYNFSATSKDELTSNIEILTAASKTDAKQPFDPYSKFYNLVNSSKNDVIDNIGNLVGTNDNPSTNIKDVLLHDLNDSLVQQNLLYITGTITAATLIIAAIVISRNNI